MCVYKTYYKNGIMTNTTKYTPYQMLDSTHLILCQQMEYCIVPVIPRNIYHIENSFIFIKFQSSQENYQGLYYTAPEGYHPHQIDHV